MNKRISTLIIILSCFFIATLGILLPMIILKSNESSFLNKKQIMITKQDNSKRQSINERKNIKFTENNIKNILDKQLDLLTSVNPTNKQLTMYEAVSSAKDSLKEFKDKGIIPTDINIDDFYNISALLYVRSEEQNSESPEYGMWDIQLYGYGISIDININAVTGHVWSLIINMDKKVNLVNVKIIDIIKKYSSYLGLNIDDTTLKNEEDGAKVHTSGNSLEIEAVIKNYSNNYNFYIHISARNKKVMN